MANFPYYDTQQQPNVFAPNPYSASQPRPMFAGQPQIGIKGRPVSSIEEVRATSIDFDGSIFFFPDLANKRIYTKQIGIDGTPILNTYEFKDTPVEPVINPSQYVTREEFESVLGQLRSMIFAPQQQETAPPVQAAPQEEKPAEKFEF